MEEGRYISEKISVSEWGDSVVKQLAQYIEKNSPDTKGFSDKNLWRMKQFYETYCNDCEKLSPVVRQISWRWHGDRRMTLRWMMEDGRGMRADAK